MNKTNSYIHTHPIPSHLDSTRNARKSIKNVLKIKCHIFPVALLLDFFMGYQAKLSSKVSVVDSLMTAMAIAIVSNFTVRDAFLVGIKSDIKAGRAKQHDYPTYLRLHFIIS